MAKGSRMYEGVKTWNVYKGCYFDCIYCKPSFQAINKRVASCKLCQNYIPHYHPERLALNKFPKSKIIFVCGNGDITFAKKEWINQIIEAVKLHSEKYPDVTYYFQSKHPLVFKPYLHKFPKSAVLLTTLETNRNFGYDSISNAPSPYYRWLDFNILGYPRKILTIEPIMDFDMLVFLQMIIDINPELVYVGYNSKPGSVKLEEPPIEKTMKLIQFIRENEIEVIEKDMDR